MTKLIESNPRPVFISWTAENGRSSDLAEALGADLVHIYPSGNLLRRYTASILATRKIIATVHPNQGVLFMLPPTPLAMIARIARGKHHVRNFYDLHTGFFYDPKWEWAASWTLRFMRGATAIVTNHNLAKLCATVGVRTYVLHDILSRQTSYSLPSNSSIVCPLSYSNDEPIARILEAANNLPETQWTLTGNAPSSVREQAPRNVRFSGFLSDMEYDVLLKEAALVLALTNRRDTMQRAGYEALMRGVPVVTSGFEVLRDFFEDSAVYVAENETDLERQIGFALETREILVKRSGEVLAKRIAEQDAELNLLRQRLAGTPA